MERNACCGQSQGERAHGREHTALVVLPWVPAWGGKDTSKEGLFRAKAKGRGWPRDGEGGGLLQLQGAAGGREMKRWKGDVEHQMEYFHPGGSMLCYVQVERVAVSQATVGCVGGRRREGGGPLVHPHPANSWHCSRPWRDWTPWLLWTIFPFIQP